MRMIILLCALGILRFAAFAQDAAFEPVPLGGKWDIGTPAGWSVTRKAAEEAFTSGRYRCAFYEDVPANAVMKLCREGRTITREFVRWIAEPISAISTTGSTAMLRADPIPTPIIEFGGDGGVTVSTLDGSRVVVVKPGERGTDMIELLLTAIVNVATNQQYSDWRIWHAENMARHTHLANKAK